MLNNFLSLIVVAICVIFDSCATQPIEHSCNKLEPLDQFKQKPQEGEWLYTNKEPFQSLNDYIDSNPLRTDSRRNSLYVVKLGYFDSVSIEIFALTKNYLAIFFQIDVKELPAIDTKRVPIKYTRKNGQLNASYILDNILSNCVPNDAHSIIALTTADIFPSEKWNYVFGLASLKKRVGVWSISRFKNNSGENENEKLALKRTIHVASHETGHMFGLKHCSVFECCMNGSNSLSELDRQQNWLCRDCLAKLCWNRTIDPVKHLAALQQFYTTYYPNGKEEAYYIEAKKIMLE